MRRRRHAYADRPRPLVHRARHAARPSQFLTSVAQGTSQARNASTVRGVAVARAECDGQEACETQHRQESARPELRTASGCSAAGEGSCRSSVLESSSWQIYATRQRYTKCADEVPAETTDAFKDLVETLDALSVAQTYFKTTYIQRELAHVSRLILLVGPPAAGAAFAVGLIYADATGPTLPPDALSLVTGALLTVVFAPLAIFSAYILRVATLVRRSVHIGSFVTSPE